MEHVHAGQDRAGRKRAKAAPRAQAGAYGSILELQASAGNRVTEQYVQRMLAQADSHALQRDDLSDFEGDGVVPLETGTTPPAFSDTVNVSTTEVAIDVRNNAFDFVNAVQAKFGGDGGRCTVAPTTFSPSYDAAGGVSGANLVWNVTVLVPTVRADPNGPISKPEAAAELAACRALAARIREHEVKHAAIESAGRANFAKTLKGKKDKEIDPALSALGRAVGRKQRALDNVEGMITLDSNNNVVVSGKDHPEYEADDAQ